MITGGLLLPFAARASVGRGVRALSWEGRAHASVGGRELDLVSQTRLVLPMLSVRSKSWIVSEGPEKARTLALEPDGAWVELPAGKRPIPVDMAIHERQQYAIYAQLLIALSKRRRPGTTLALSNLPYPDVAFAIGPDGRPVAADVTVDAPEPGKPRIAEHLTFAGRIEDKGIAWPETITIAQDGKPYFTLHVSRFTVELA